MAELQTDAREAVRVALGAARSEDLIEGVKAAIVTELEALDPTVSIKATDYFNHTSAPDLELTWPDDRRGNRFVYLRYSLQAAVAGQDFRSLGSLNPVVLALRDDQPEEVERARRDMAETTTARGLLATDVGALDDLGRRESSHSAPLLDLVRGNVVRGARGLLVDDGVERLATQAARTDTDDIDDQSAELASFRELVAEIFLPEAATRLARAASLIDAGRTGELSGLLGDDDGQDQRRGTLSAAELRVLLPYFLRPGAPGRTTAFWQYLGSLTSLAGIESMWDVLLERDLSAFVEPNLDAFRAKRALVALRVETSQDAERAEVQAAQADSADAADVGSEGVERWQMYNHRLALNAGDWRVVFTSDQRSLRGREDSSSARWDDLAGALSRFDLVGVNLRGAARRLDVTAERAADVYRDVAIIRERIEDDFHVPAVTVRARRPDAAYVHVDFTTMLAEPGHDAASLRDLAEPALTILGYRNPLPSDELDTVLP